MRTEVPSLLPLFRSEMQVRLLALLLLQPERQWTLQTLAEALAAPPSSVHRELARAEAAGILRRDDTARPHLFCAATDDGAYEPLAELLRRSIGIEMQLRRSLDRPDVHFAAIYGSWASGTRRADSDIDVLVVGDASQRELRRIVRAVGKAAGRNIDLTVLTGDEFRRLLGDRSSFVRHIMQSPITVLIGDLGAVAEQ